MYSNYTLNTNNYKDINYVKFWYDGNKNRPQVNKVYKPDEEIKIEKLFEYRAGDMAGATKCSSGDEPNADRNSFDKKYIDRYVKKVVEC